MFSRRPHLLTLAAIFLITLVGALAVYQTHPVLYDTDAYYHLAIARQMAQEGFLDDLPGVRFSLLDPTTESGFGDKEFLFHLLLAPFTTLGTADDPELGGRLALALFDAFILTLIAAAGARLVGKWGYLLPFALVLSAPEFTWRLVRLRPELLALTVLLLAVEAVARERYRTLAVLAFVFTLGYTAFHAFLGLCGLAFAWPLLQRWGRSPNREGRLSRDTGQEKRAALPWGLILYPLLGATAALVLHPGFPHNVEIWAVQNLSFFAHKDLLDVGTEIRPQTTAAVFALYLPWALGLLCLLASRTSKPTAPPNGPGEPDGPQHARRTAYLTITALTFGLLYLHMSRFALYMVPFVSLALLAYWVRPGHGLGRRCTLPGGRRVPLAVGLGLCAALAIPQAVTQASIFLQRTDPGPRDARREDRRALATALQAAHQDRTRPPHVAASWQMTPLYLFHAPQGRYLNVLDPIFMALPYPLQHFAWQALASGQAPDPVLVAAQALDSDYLALSLATAEARLRQRLDADPRVETLHAGIHALYRWRPVPLGTFVLDWQVEGPLGMHPYPRLADPRLRRLEGYVDLLRVVQGEVTPETCVRVTSTLQVLPAGADAIQRFELAPAGATALWLEEGQGWQLHLTVASDLGAVLGSGVTFEVGARRPTRVRILTCPARAASAPSTAPVAAPASPPSALPRLGFYLRRLPGTGGAEW